MLTLFSILVAIFAVSLFLSILSRVGVVVFPRAWGGTIALSLIFSSIALGIALAIRYAPALWNLTQ